MVFKDLAFLTVGAYSCCRFRSSDVDLPDRSIVSP